MFLGPREPVFSPPGSGLLTWSPQVSLMMTLSLALSSFTRSCPLGSSVLSHASQRGNSTPEFLKSQAGQYQPAGTKSSSIKLSGPGTTVVIWRRYRP